MRRTKEQAEATREALLEAATRVFARDGYAGARLSDIAKEAKVTRGAVYHHFGSKMNLFFALHEYKIDPYFKRMETVFASSMPALEKIRTVLIEFLDGIFSDPDFASRQRLQVFLDAELDKHPQIKTLLTQHGESFHRLLAATIRDGMSTGDIRAGIDPDLAALNILAYLKGLISVIYFSLGGMKIRHRTAELVDTILGGL